MSRTSRIEEQVSSYAPILLFVFARPEHTRQSLDALSRNHLAIQSDLIIYSDGARDGTQKMAVDEVRELAHSVRGFKSVKVIERKTNYGLARNISEGVTEACQQYGKVIVLEDDIVTSPYFLSFMNGALDRYEKVPDVWHISGWNYPIEHTDLGDAFFIRIMNCWGWATWSDRWKYFEKAPDKLVGNWNKKTIKRFNLDGVNDFWAQVLANHRGEKSTWAVFWYASIFENGGLCLNPTGSLVLNIGHDGSGENCGTTSIFASVDLADHNMILPANIEESSLAVERIRAFYKRTPPRTLQRVQRRIKTIWGRISSRG